MLNEKWLWSKLRSALPMHGLHPQSFQDCGRNVPDIYVTSLQCSPFWLELKVVATCERKIPFRKGQPLWIDEHAANGGRCLVLVLCCNEDTIYLLKGEQVRRLQAKKLVDSEPWQIAKLSFDLTSLWRRLSELLLDQPEPRVKAP